MAAGKYVIAHNVPEHFYFLHENRERFTGLPCIAIFDTIQDAIIAADEYLSTHEVIWKKPKYISEL